VIRKTAKKVAEAIDRGLYREVSIELVQHYHDKTHKLIKTEEGAKTYGRSFRKALPGQPPTVQLMDAKTFEVLALIEVPNDDGKTDYSVKGPKPPVKDTEVEGSEDLVLAKDSVPQDEGEGMAKPKKKAAKKATKKATAKKAVAKAPKKAAPKAVKKAPKKAVKKAAAKPVKAAPKPAKKTAAPKPVDAPKSKMGQNGPPVDFSKKAPNAKEMKVLGALNHGKGARTIAEVAGDAFPNKPAAQANSWVRNAFRRLTRGDLVLKLERGSYKLSKAGQKVLAAS